ncbi:MAG: diguanylate cyclase [bacterium]|nr:diguanylate cyclase [bacterium]
MNNKDKKVSNTAQIYVRESGLLEKAKEIHADTSISKETLLQEYIHLGNEYGKMLKQTIKITRIGDSNQRKLLSANEQIEKQKEELSKAYDKLDRIARMDPLTQLSNRRDFLEKFQDEIHRLQRYGKPFSVVLGDIDHFKTINDSFGHDCGDNVLVSVAKIIKSAVRKLDVVGRWGGEEFILLLPEAPMAGGKVVAEGIRRKVESESFCCKDSPDAILVTMTFGVSEFDGTDDIDGCIKKADEALYAGKRTGRNRVVLAGVTRG